MEAARLAILAEKAGGEKVAQDVAEMRARLRPAKPGQGALEAKDEMAAKMDSVKSLKVQASTRAAAPGSACLPPFCRPAVRGARRAPGRPVSRSWLPVPP